MIIKSGLPTINIYLPKMKILTILLITMFLLAPLRYATITKAQFSAKDCSRTSTSTVPHIGVELIPLDAMSANQYYPNSSHAKRQEGGLYGNGANSVEALPSHYQKAVNAVSEIIPRDANGNPDSVNGKICVVSIGMSNTRREYNTFISKANVDQAKSAKVQLVNTAQESMVASSWAKWGVPSQPDPDPWEGSNGFVSKIASEGCSPHQVQAAWIKLTNANPQQPGSDDFPVYVENMYRNMTKVVTFLRQYSDVKVAYLSTRMYGGYSLIQLSPEPSVYESAFAMRWLIMDQLGTHQQDTSIVSDVPYADVTYDNAPVLLWGPYFWANGLIPRNDGLTWTCNDMASDGVHPEESAKQKISDRLLAFLKEDSLAKVWFTGSGILPSITPSTAVTPTPGDTPGDGDGNGIVNGIDFIIWLTHYGQTVSGTNSGDYDGNGQIGIGDYLVWIGNYGS